MLQTLHAKARLTKYQKVHRVKDENMALRCQGNRFDLGLQWSLSYAATLGESKIWPEKTGG